MRALTVRQPWAWAIFTPVRTSRIAAGIIDIRGESVKPTLKLWTFQIGAPPKRGEGLRIGATRRPPRGVPKAMWQKDGYFDVWLPAIAPSARLLDRYRRRDSDDPAIRRKFFRSYERELGQTPARHAIQLLVALAKRTPIAVGCFCEDESRCHRSRLHKVMQRAALRRV